jgi:glycosyltransferase involved in cell wall biosynthesis
MVSVLIETLDDEEALARTLASLVGGAIEGIVREVIVVDRGSTDQTAYVAEHAGCHFVAAGGLAAAIRQAKGDWLLVLEPGARLVDGWVEPVVTHMSAGAVPACFSRTRNSRAPFLARLFSRPPALSVGLLVTKRDALARKADTAEALARGLSRKRLDGEIVPAPRRNA